MATVDLDSLTDSEIRARFIELGSPVGPVTATTRKTLIKKLKVLLNQNQSGTSDLNDSKYDPRRISSGEESDEGGSRSRQRRSMPPPRTTKSPKRKSPSRATLSNDPLANSTFSEAISTRSRPTREQVDYLSSTTSPTVETRRSARSSIGLNNSVRSPTSTVDPAPTYEKESDSSHARSYRPSLFSTSNNDNFESSNTATSPRYTDFGLSDAFKSRLQASGSTSFTSPSSYTSPTSRLDTSTNQPYCSDFVRRLSSSRTSVGASTSPSLTSKLLDVKESDDEDSGPTPVYARFTQGHKSGTGLGAKPGRRVMIQEGWFPFDSPISAILLCVFLLFFIVIGVTYVNMHSVDTSITTPTDITYPLCSETSSQPRLNCIREVDKDTTTRIFKIIYKELHDRVASSPCKNVGEGNIGISDKEILDVVTAADGSLGIWLVEQQLANVRVLINANPQFKMSDITGGVVLLKPPVSLYCYMVNNLLFLADWALKILAALVAVFLGYAGVYWYMAKEARHKEEVFRLVSNILEIVSARSQAPDSFVAINHVKDQLISPHQRESKDKLWRDAVSVLETDSRIRTEQQEVEGELCLVWRWLASAYNPNKRKVWQGQAFDTMEGSVNSLQHSPTSCLKIRHMFDAALEEGEGWVGTVVDAILEKCGGAKILHIAVERQSREGCVYIKCATPRDAGIAYRALHGSWFDSNLVTVKYIREQRYLERFPESARSTQPLYPSNDHKNSLK